MSTNKESEIEDVSKMTESTLPVPILPPIDEIHGANLMDISRVTGKRDRPEDIDEDSRETEPNKKKVKRGQSRVMKKRKELQKGNTWKTEIMRVLRSDPQKKFTANEIWKEIKIRLDSGEFISDINTEKQGIKRVYNASRLSDAISTEVVKGKCYFYLAGELSPEKEPEHEFDLKEELDLYLTSSSDEERKRKKKRRRMKKLKRRKKKERKKEKDQNFILPPPEIPDIASMVPSPNIPLLPNAANREAVGQLVNNLGEALCLTPDRKKEFLEKCRKLCSSYLY